MDECPYKKVDGRFASRYNAKTIEMKTAVMETSTIDRIFRELAVSASQ